MRILFLFSSFTFSFKNKHGSTNCWYDINQFVHHRIERFKVFDLRLNREESFFCVIAKKRDGKSPNDRYFCNNDHYRCQNRNICSKLYNRFVMSNIQAHFFMSSCLSIISPTYFLTFKFWNLLKNQFNFSSNLLFTFNFCCYWFYNYSFLWFKWSIIFGIYPLLILRPWIAPWYVTDKIIAGKKKLSANISIRTWSRAIHANNNQKKIYTKKHAVVHAC